MLLLSPKKKERSQVIEKAKLLYMPFPVYIDVRNEFMSKNKVVPEDALYHIMYVGTDGRIRMVGDPSASDKVKAVFDEVKDVE